MAIAICLAVTTFGAQAATEPFLKLTTTAPAAVQEFSLQGAEIQIKGNTVTVAYAAEPAKNRSFDFDKVQSFEFSLRTVTSIDEVKTEIFRAYTDGAGILHVKAEQPLEQVNVYNINGALVASQKTGDTQVQINISAFPRGVYIVQVGVNRLKIVKS